MIDEQEYTDDEQREAKRAAIEAFAAGLLESRKEAIEGRVASGVERRWREDQDVFDGLDAATKRQMIDYATGEAPVKGDGAPRSRVIVNIVRSKTETAAGRFADISMPVDDRNWGLKVTPVPELVGALKDNRPAMQAGRPITDEQGQQATMAQVAGSQIEEAKQRMLLMESEIDDQLTESEYNSEARKAILDAAKLGTGVLKGPSVVKRYSKRWLQQTGVDEAGQPMSVHQLEVVEEHKPASRRADPWNVFPDPACGDDIRKARYVWERDTITPRAVADLVGLPGYQEGQLRLVLSEKPIRTVARENRQGNVEAVAEAIAKGNLYEIWEYHGEVDSDSLEILGCDCQGQSGNVSACVVMINDRPVKAVLNVLDTGDLPYDFFQWAKVSDSVWGIGVPRMLIWQQRIITAAWRATMDNAGDAAGSMRVLSKDIEPADGNWTMTRNKTWWYTGDGDARAAFAQFQLDSRQQDLANIMELALRFADMETSIPTLFQGEGQTAPETLGATNIMVDSNNVALRMRVKAWDDQVTRPHLTRYYHFNMQYSPKEEIKGDYQVDPRGVRILMEKDQQAQALVNIWPLMADPEIALIVDKKKAAKQLFGAYRLDIMKEDEEIAQAQQQAAQAPPAPNQANVDAANIRAQAQLQVAQINQEADMAELELKQQMAQADREHDAQMKQMDLQIAMLKMANDRNISLDSIKAALASDTMKLKTQKELSSLNRMAKQVATPPTEPVGQAPDGQAYQR